MRQKDAGGNSADWTHHQPTGHIGQGSLKTEESYEA